jgi:predicted nucleotidyltransferase
MPSVHDLDATVAALVEHLDGHWGVDAAWLFGSQTRTPRATSDIDLAVLFRTPPTTLELLETRAELESLAGRPVDIVDLDHASPIIAFQALKTGRLVADRNGPRRVDFTAHLPGRYEDVKRVRQTIEETILSRMAHGRA